MSGCSQYVISETQTINALIRRADSKRTREMLAQMIAQLRQQLQNLFSRQ